ncbi:MAG TPA: histidine kinase [Thermoanaerobaculia bacterium]|nr:histidine kinase [Thermoanaerobaculia bacterium]
MTEPEEISARLGRWPRHVLLDRRAVAQECVEHCRHLFEARRVVLALDEADEPWLTVAVADDAGFAWREEVESEVWPLVAPELEDVTFFIDPGVTRVTVGRDQRALEVGQPISPQIRVELGDGCIASIPIRSDSVEGRLFICEPGLDVDTTVLVGDMVGLLVATRFEAAAHCLNAIRDAVDHERIRLARDLHDGLLQSFTGVVLQLETIHSTLGSKPDEARRMITETQGIIMADQRDLRRFVEHLRPRTARRETVFDFTARLEELRSRFSNQWGVRLAFDVEHIDPVVFALIGQETFRLIHEAVTNSAKHGRASDVRVGVRTAGSEMYIEVADNGAGFPFHGRRTLDEMRESGGGPMVLAERVQSLNGSLVVDSTESGATIRISVPLGWGAA